MSWLIKAWGILRGPLGDILKATIQLIRTLATTEIIRIIKFAVDKVNADPSLVGDKERRDACLAAIKDEAGKSGIFIKDGVAAFLLEAVVQLRKLFG